MYKYIYISKHILYNIIFMKKDLKIYFIMKSTLYTKLLKNTI